MSTCGPSRSRSISTVPTVSHADRDAGVGPLGRSPATGRRASPRRGWPGRAAAGSAPTRGACWPPVQEGQGRRTAPTAAPSLPRRRSPTRNSWTSSTTLRSPNRSTRARSPGCSVTRVVHTWARRSPLSASTTNLTGRDAVVHHGAQWRRTIAPPRRLVDDGERQVVRSWPNLASAPSIDAAQPSTWSRATSTWATPDGATVRQPFDPLPHRRPIGVGEDDHVEIGRSVLDARLEEQPANGRPRELARAHERHSPLVAQIDGDRHHRQRTELGHDRIGSPRSGCPERHLRSPLDVAEADRELERVGRRRDVSTTAAVTLCPASRMALATCGNRSWRRSRSAPRRATSSARNDGLHVLIGAGCTIVLATCVAWRASRIVGGVQPIGDGEWWWGRCPRRVAAGG